MKKWNLLLVVFVLVMLCGCGNAAAKNPEPAQPIGKMQTEDIAVVLPASEPEPDIAPPPEEEVITEEPEAEEDPSSPNYVYHPSKYDISYHEFDDGYWIATIDNPGVSKVYLTDQFGLPRQDYFWIDDETFDCIGYLFACGVMHIEMTNDYFHAYFSPAGAEDATHQPTVSIACDDYYTSDDPKVTTVYCDAYKIGAYTKTLKTTDEKSALLSEKHVFLYDQTKYPAQGYKMNTYYIDILPIFVNAALSIDEGSTACPLDGYEVPHVFTIFGEGITACAESE